MSLGYQTVGSAANYSARAESEKRRAYATTLGAVSAQDENQPPWEDVRTANPNILNDIFNHLDALDLTLRCIDAGLTRCGIGAEAANDMCSPSRNDGFLTVRWELSSLVSLAQSLQARIETLA